MMHAEKYVNAFGFLEKVADIMIGVDHTVSKKNMPPENIFVLCDEVIANTAVEVKV